MKRTAAVSKDKLDKELEEMRTPFNEAFGNDSPLSQSAVSTEQLTKNADQAAEKVSTAEPVTNEVKADSKQDSKPNE